MNCLDCGVELKQVDVIINRRTQETFTLYVCRNEYCDHYGQVYNDAHGDLHEGDPSGLVGNQIG